MALALADVGVEVNPYARSNPLPPGIQVLPPEITYNFSFGGPVGYLTMVFTVQGYVALNEEIGPQQLLDELLLPSGLKAALEQDRTLGGLVADLNVEYSGPPRQLNLEGGSPMLVVDWRVSMHVLGA